MNDNFFKFPTTPHLAALGDFDPRSDKLFTEAERRDFLSGPVIVEEKIDGANLGISFDSRGNIRLQNRGAYLQVPLLGQWKKLENWVEIHLNSLFDHLANRYILFGEWCFARHSLAYDKLPDWFLGFDIYDKAERRFLSTVRRDRFLNGIGISAVPLLGKGNYSLNGLLNLMSKSTLCEAPAEGVYLRKEEDDWLTQRAKIVRPAFVQSVSSHWSKEPIHPNHLSNEIYK